MPDKIKIMEITKQQQHNIDIAKKIAKSVNSIEDGLTKREILYRLRESKCPYYSSVACSGIFECYETLGRKKFFKIEQRPVHFSRLVDLIEPAKRYKTGIYKKTSQPGERVVAKKHKTKQQYDDYWTIKIKKPFRKLIKIIRFIKTL